MSIDYFPLCSYSENKIEVELDLSDYATKSSLKNETGADTSQFAKKDENLKSKVFSKLDTDKLSELDPDKLKPVSTDLSKLSDVVKNGVSKKKDYNAKIEYWI